jgi:hypothetical protein
MQDSTQLKYRSNQLALDGVLQEEVFFDAADFKNGLALAAAEIDDSAEIEWSELALDSSDGEMAAFLDLISQDQVGFHTLRGRVGTDILVDRAGD